MKRDAERLRIHLTPEQIQSLSAFHDLLCQHADPAGLVSPADVPRLYDRHIRDCLASATRFQPEDRTSYDLGSGAGLPGIVLAVALPTVRFGLVEPKRRRIAFLELAVERLRLSNVEVMGERAEDVAHRLHSGDASTGLGLADVVTARAFAPPARSWEAAKPLLAPRGRLVYFLGEDTDLDPIRTIEGGPRVSVERVLDSGPVLAIMTRT